MTGDVHNVIDATQEPQVAVFVTLSAVTGEVHALEAAPIRFLKALGVAVDAARHRRPGLGDDEVTTFTIAHAVAVVVHDIDTDTG